jgi:hypothetical protein
MLPAETESTELTSAQMKPDMGFGFAKGASQMPRKSCSCMLAHGLPCLS